MAPIQVTQDAYDFAVRLAEAAQAIVDEMDLTGAAQTEGAALYAGLIAKCNARDGCAVEAAEMAACIVRRIASGGHRVN